MTSTKPSAETKTLSLEEVQVTDLSSVLPTTVAVNYKLCLRETIFSPLPVITTLSTSGKTEEEVEEELEEEVEGLEVEEDEEVEEDDGCLLLQEARAKVAVTIGKESKTSFFLFIFFLIIFSFLFY